MLTPPRPAQAQQDIEEDLAEELPEIPLHIIQHLATPQGMARMLDAMDHRIHASIWIFSNPTPGVRAEDPSTWFDVQLLFPHVTERADEDGMLCFRMARSDVRTFSNIVDHLSASDPDIVVNIHGRRHSDSLPQHIAMSQRVPVSMISSGGTVLECVFPHTNRIMLTRESEIESTGSSLVRRTGIVSFAWCTDVPTMMQCVYS